MRHSGEILGEDMTEAQARLIASYFSPDAKINFESFCRIMSSDQ
jgi:hypothetical protein